MRIGTIDPGLTSGCAIVDFSAPKPVLLYWRVIKTDTADPRPSRLSSICREWDDFFTQIDGLGIEDQVGTFVGKLGTQDTGAGALSSVLCQGMAIAWATLRDIPFYEVSPQQVKIAVLGRGASSASKRQVSDAVRRILGEKLTEHAADAAALSFAVAPRLRLDRAMRRR